MYVLLLIHVILLRATNALECWQGLNETTTPGGTTHLMALGKCPAGYERCSKLACSMDEKALEGLPDVPPGTKSVTSTIKACLPAIGECELQPKEGIDPTGVAFMTLKKYCKMSCCESDACNGESNARNGESNARNGESNARNGESNARNRESNARKVKATHATVKATHATVKATHATARSDCAPSARSLQLWHCLRCFASVGTD